MSAKCNYSSKYYPLLRSLYDLNQDNFYKFIEENFIDPDVAKNMILSRIDPSPTQITPAEVEQISSRTGIRINTESDNSQEFYIGHDDQYTQMKKSFIEHIVSSSIFDMNSEKFIDANKKVGDSTILNKNILEYKKNLLKIVAAYMNTTIDEDIWKDDYVNILNNFKSIVDNNPKNDDTYFQAFNAYVILKTFDNLITLVTPFIKINKEYKDFFSPNRYSYAGPNMRFDTNWKSGNEFMSQEENTSDIVKILLDYFPEVNANGEIIKGTSIKLKGFNSIMGKLKVWAENNTDSEIASEWAKDVGKRDMLMLLNKYRSYLNAYKIKNPEHVTYLIEKLNGIIRFIYNKNMPDNIKIMFSHLVDKTVVSSYISYALDDETGALQMKNLVDRPVMLHQKFINEILEAVPLYWARNKAKFNELKRKYSITITPNLITIGDKQIIIDPRSGTVSGDNFDNIDELIGDFTQLLITDDFDDVSERIFGRNVKNKSSLYLPILASALLNSSNYEYKLNYGQSRDLAKVLNVINGSDTVNVIKNSEGNNLPIFQMVCLSYLHKNIHDRIKERIDRNPRRLSQYGNNPVYQNIQHIHRPKIRSEVSINDNTKQSVALNVDDVMYLAIGYDYFQGLFSEQSNTEGRTESGVVGMQVHTYSDKNKHFVMQFDFGENWEFENGPINFKNIISKYFKSGDPKDMLPILDAWFECNKNQMETVANNLLSDFNTALGINFQSLTDLNTYLNGVKDITSIRTRFKEVGIDILEEYHISKNPITKRFQVNETLMNLYNIFTNREEFNNFLNYQFNQFLNNSEGAWNRLAKDPNITAHAQFDDSKWVKNGVLVKQIGNEYNPLLYSYFIMDSFISNEYNKMMIGDVWYHPNKDKTNATKELRKTEKAKQWTTEQLSIESAKEYNRYAMASRWIAQVKRMVIYGATYHSYAQGLKNGVASEVKMAVISDFPAMTYNITGDSNENDSMDGSGFTSPYFSRQQNISLIDAAVRGNKKTIYNDIDENGRPVLLKWAEYEITNGIRRKHGMIDAEKIFAKMHNIRFNKLIDFNHTYDNLYYQDTDTGNYYQIIEININNGIASRTIKDPNTGKIEVQPFGNIDTIYKLDQLFGGAWAAEYNEDTHQYQYTEKNQDYINDIICNEELKDYMIGWLVNKSGIKVGAANLNDKKRWTNDEDLDYVVMSTRFGGLQMNADHELDEAEVTEASQMISALEQNGFTHDIANAVYIELGKFVSDSVKDLQDSANNGHKETLYKIFGKAIVKSFQTGNKDTLGLAQAFISLAQEGLKNNNITYKIPFSSPSINGIFNSTVTTSIIKNAIRRHYNGVAAVLNPSYGIVGYYEYGNEIYSYENLINKVLPTFQGTELEGRTIDSLIQDTNYHTNPLIVEVTPDNPIDFEDTIILYDENDNIIQYNGSDTIKIDTFEKYEYFRNYESHRIRKHLLRPKNLRGSDTIFTYNIQTFTGTETYQESVYNSPYNRALYLLNKISSNTLNDISSELSEEIEKLFGDLIKTNNLEQDKETIKGIANDQLKLIRSEIKELLGDIGDDVHITDEQFKLIKKDLKTKQQTLLNNLADKKPITWGKEEDDQGNLVDNILTIENVIVKPAQIIMGKLYAKELGLLPGDSVSDIKYKGPEFFKDRIKGYYTHNNPDLDSYDAVLYDDTGKKLFVKYKTKDDINCFPNDNYKEIEGDIYYNGKKLFSSEGKKFVTYIDSNGNEHDTVIVDNSDRIKEIQNSKVFNNIEYNYQPNNYKQLIQLEFGEGLVQIPVLKSKVTPNINPFYYKNIAEFNSNEEIIEALKTYHIRTFNDKISKIAKDKYEAFIKSLRFIGTRIPCQSMQSFMPLEVIEFSDSEVNEVYVPPMMTWIQGSDYDKFIMS